MKTPKVMIIALAAIAVAAGGWLMYSKADNQNQTLRVAFPTAQKSTSYEPTKIRLDYEYIFLENIYSTLVEMDQKGVIKPGIAEKADWIDGELKLKIRKDLKTVSGTAITPEDVVFSLKRLLVLSSNTHGNFKDLVCPDFQMQSIEEDCPGIRQEGEFVYLNAKGKKPFLLPMLASIDFAIIPKGSIDTNTLEIQNYSETSGPYYVADDDGNGNIELRVNPHHYHAASDIAQVVKYVPITSPAAEESLRALSENRVDHLTTVDSSKADTLLAFAEKNPEFSSHITMKIRSLILVFTERGQKELSAAERRYVGARVRNAFAEIFKDSAGFQQRDEFFPSMGEGGLSEDQRAKLLALETDLQEPDQPVRLGLIKRGSLEDWSIPIQKELPQADCYIEDNVPDFKKYPSPNEIPHAFVASTDTGFMEDISLISYSMNAGLLGLSKEERKDWLANYMTMEQKDDRIKELKKLHFEALSGPALVPLMALPYAALIRKPWRMELSELYANNQLWLIKTQ